MKILIVLAGYFPAQKYGGPPVSISNFCNLMKSYLECYIVTSNHENGSQQPLDGVGSEWQTQGNAHILYLKEHEMELKRYQEILEMVRPEWIYLNSIFDMKRTWPFLKLALQKNIRILMAPRGELCKNAFKKKYKKIPYIYALRKYWNNSLLRYQATSTEENMMIEKILRVSSDKIHMIDNIPTIPDSIRICCNKEQGKLSLVFLSRIHPKKNLIFALECLCKIHGNVKLDIYGPIEDANYWNLCHAYIENMPKNILVKYCGIVDHADIQNVLRKYEAFFFPTLSENYGHVIAEALFAGLPIIISDQTPWSSVNAYNAGWAISLNNQEEFIQCLQQMVDCGKNVFEKMSLNSINFVKKQVDLDKIQNAYKEILYEKK